MTARALGTLIRSKISILSVVRATALSSFLFQNHTDGNEGDEKRDQKINARSRFMVGGILLGVGVMPHRYLLARGGVGVGFPAGIGIHPGICHAVHGILVENLIGIAAGFLPIGAVELYIGDHALHWDPVFILLRPQNMDAQRQHSRDGQNEDDLYRFAHGAPSFSMV